MGRKHRGAGRGSQIIDKVKNISERREREVGGEASSSEPSTSGSSHEKFRSSGSTTSQEKFSTGPNRKRYGEAKYQESPGEPSSREPAPKPSYRDLAQKPASRDLARMREHRDVEQNISSGEPAQKPSYRDLAQKPASRDLARAREHTEVEQNLSSGEPAQKSFREPTKQTAAVGRGQFLSQLAKQSKFKSSSEPEESREPPPSRQTRDKKEQSTSRLASVTKKMAMDREPSAPIVRLGETGVNAKFHCNYITLRTSPGKGIFEYEVKFEPNIEDERTRNKLIYGNIPVKKGIQCYDGACKLFLPEAVNKNIVLEVENPIKQSPVIITATYKRQVRPHECSVFYNILLNNCAKVLNLTRLGRHHYDPTAHLLIPQHKLEVWPGYVTSVEEYEGGIHLCCDIKHRILRSDTAYDLLVQIYKADPDNFKKRATREILGRCILTRYNNHMYRVDDISWNETPLSKFSARGKEVSYVDYYKAQYDLSIKDEHQPLLIHIPKGKSNIPKICLIPEFSYLTGLTDSMRKDMKVMKEVAAYTRITPAERESSLKRFVENINNNRRAREMLENWGLQICCEPLLINGRILPPENIFFRNERTGKSDLSEWSRFLCKQGVLRSIDILNWVMFFTARDRKLAETFLRAIQESGTPLGIRINPPLMICLKDDRIGSYISSLKENIRPKTQIVLCLCSTPREDRYSAIKKLCCLELPVPSQIVNCGTIARGDRLRVVAQNVVLQMNNKLGGASWTVQIPLKNCMVCGIDTYHDPERRDGSVGAFVASLDSRFTRWYSQVCLQEPKQELLTGLGVCFVTAVQKYHEVNKILPQHIIIFRDGVSDGHLQQTEDVEIKQFLQACNLIGNFNPKFSYVVVQKRINTKFYLKSDHLENPKPGSIVDHTITRRNYYDFFLVSQHVYRGTATPSHYIVLYDNSNLKPDHMQRLTYQFCHMYYNWPGTIRIPAPCHYAHKLANLVGQNIKKEFDGSLTDKLFYL